MAPSDPGVEGFAAAMSLALAMSLRNCSGARRPVRPRAGPRGTALPACLLLLLALHPPAPAAAQPAAADTARLVGQVVSALDGKPLPGAVVSLLRSGMGAISDSAGNFAIPRTAAGQDTVEVRYVGYERNLMPLYLEPERTTRVVLLLSPNVVRLADLKVEVERERLDILRGFDERRAKGIGHYFSFEEIQKRRPRYTSDLLRQVPGLRVGPSISGRAEVISGRSAIPCTPALFLDGIHYRDMHVDDVLATELGAVEVYTGAAQVPPQFATAAAASGCGVIVLWSRRGFQREGG